MKKFNLSDPTIIFSMSNSEKEELKQYLMCISLKDSTDFLFLLLDSCYHLSSHTEEDKITEKFLADPRFAIYRNILIRKADDDLTDEDWRKAETKIKKFQRAKKLNKMNGIDDSMMITDDIPFPEEEIGHVDKKIEKQKRRAVKKDMNYFSKKTI